MASKRLAVVLFLTAMVMSLPAFVGAAPATWSLNRASFGVDASGAQWTGSPAGTSFLPGTYLSWSATSGLSLAGTVQRDFARHTTIGKAGFRFVVLANEKGQVGVGANLVGYGDQTAWLGIVKPTSWETCVNGSYDLAQDKSGRTILFGIAGASFDKANNVKEVRVGLRAQVLGGRP